MSTDDQRATALRLVSSMSRAEQRELLDTLLGQTAIGQPKAPTLRRKPRKVRGFQVRIDLLGVKPPIWRRLILPGDLTLNLVHVVLNEAMGWTDSHLHRFRTDNGPYAPHFITEFDLEEGERGVLGPDRRGGRSRREAGR